MTIDTDIAYPLAEAARRGDLNALGDLLRNLAETVAELSSTELSFLSDVSATATEVNRAADVSARIVNLTAATLSLTEAAHDGKTVTVNKADGSTLTLPAATGSGARFRLIVGTTITSVGLIVQVADATDVMTGGAWLSQDGADTVVMFEAGATSDTITLNGTTTGGLKGDLIECEDIASNLWFVRLMGSATGTEATPFSAAV